MGTFATRKKVTLTLLCEQNGFDSKRNRVYMCTTILSDFVCFEEYMDAMDCLGLLSILSSLIDCLLGVRK